MNRVDIFHKWKETQKMIVVNAVKVFFNNWIYPVIFFGATLIIFFFSGFENARSHYFQNIASIIFCIGLLLLIVSSIFQFFRKKWREGLLSFVILIGGIIFVLIWTFIYAFVIPTIDGDKWADNLEIPKNIELNKPIDLTFIVPIDDSVRNIKKQFTDLQLYNSVQKGIYQYDFWIGKIEKGTIYLKAFEITQEIELSEDRLKGKSEIPVFNPGDSIVKFGSLKDFTIYEGDWDKPYAARFEVWFKSEATGRERKLFQKKYIIEGWMR